MQNQSLKVAGLLLSLLFVLVIQGAIPFVMAPTMGQAVWLSGFAHSIANGGMLNLYALNFGGPDPSPIAFGLTGALPVSYLLQLGLHAVDAYTIVVALWMAVAFISALLLARHVGLGYGVSVGAAVAWMTMPVVWGHAGYSMVSVGLALLSFYFLCLAKLMKAFLMGAWQKTSATLYLGGCIVSVFTDGYSFMMFAVGSSIVLLLSVMTAGAWRSDRGATAKLFATHAVCFLVAYGLYVAYLGQATFDPHPMSFFRGWGADIVFFAMPTAGMHLLPDLLNLSVHRGDDSYWGDASVWTTTFVLPLIVATIVAVFFCSRWSRDVRSSLARFLPIFIVSAFGFYMALGPSFKVDVVKPMEAKNQRLMHEKYAPIPTGTALLSENLPGFDVMRASYRWTALGIFGAWWLLLLALRGWSGKNVATYSAILFGSIVLLNLPNPLVKWRSDVGNRVSFRQMDVELVEALEKDLVVGETVAFLPWGNDFLVNYLAGKIGVRTYNVGGDKNLKMARESWPDIMKEFPMSTIDDGFAARVVRVLKAGEASVVVLPYVDLLWAAHHWPDGSVAEEKLKLRDVVGSLSKNNCLNVLDREYYVIVRLPKDGGHSSPASVAVDPVGRCV